LKICPRAIVVLWGKAQVGSGEGVIQGVPDVVVGGALEVTQSAGRVAGAASVAAVRGPCPIDHVLTRHLVQAAKGQSRAREPGRTFQARLMTDWTSLGFLRANSPRFGRETHYFRRRPRR